MGTRKGNSMCNWQRKLEKGNQEDVVASNTRDTLLVNQLRHRKEDFEYRKCFFTLDSSRRLSLTVPEPKLKLGKTRTVKRNGVVFGLERVEWNIQERSRIFHSNVYPFLLHLTMEPVDFCK